MKNNFDLTNYMKRNKVGAYQQLNEMWYQDINQALGDFNVIKEEAIEETPLHPDTEEDENGNTYFTEDEMEEGKKKLAFVIPCPDAYDIEEEAEHFQHLLDKAGVKAKVKANQVGEEAEVYTKDEKKARKVIEKNGYQIGWNEDDNLEEMGGVKTIGDAGKMATPNSRPNLGRHRSSDMLDKMSKKDHKTNTVTGAKAAAYKAPHMKEDNFKSFGDPDLTLNDLNKDIVITPFELEKTWNDVYGEDFKTEYSGAYSYLTKNYKNFTIVDLVDVWERMYGEDFLYEYSGISKWLFSNQGKTSSKDKVAPKMKEDVNEIGGHGDAPDSPKLQAAAKYLVKNRDRYLTQDYFFPNGIRILSSKSDKDLYDYIVNNMHSDELYDVIGHMKSEIEKAMYANTDPNIADPINEDDDIFAGSDKAKWDNYGNETSEWDTEIAGQTVKGWTAEETQGGAIAWQNPRYPNAHIYATPGWEGVDGIAFELHDSEDGYMDEPKIQKVVGAGTDLWKTKEGYMALMAKAFTVVEKMLIPSEEMAEDDGTGRQINHDFNDDISKDPSEFEDSVYEDEDPFGSIKTGIDKITQGDDEDFIDDDKLDRFYEMGGRQLTKAADTLLDDGFSKREIINYLQNYM